MRPDKDLMTRLAAADPLPDAERLDPGAEREAEALLARLLATPAAPQAPRPRVRRWTVAVAAVACVAALVFVALNLVDSDAPGPGVEQAVAAKTVAALTRADSVYHVLQHRRITGNLGGKTAVPVQIESWRSSDGRFHEKYFADTAGRRGRLLEEAAGTRPATGGEGALIRYFAEQDELFGEGVPPSAAAGKLPVIDPAGDPATALRELEARGALHVDGTTTVGNRHGYRLVSDPIDAEGGEQRLEYVVDSATYLPLSERWSLTRGSEKTGFVITFLVYERLPLDAQTRAQLDLDPHPGARCSAEADQPSDPALGFPNPC
jgi:hypothetical protein